MRKVYDLLEVRRQSPRQRLEHFDLHRGDALDESAEGLAGEDERVRWLRGSHGRGARRAADQGNLAEEDARAELVDLAAAAPNLGCALDDHDELPARRPLLREDVAR